MPNDDPTTRREPSADADLDVISDPGMNKDLRQNTVEIDVMAVRAIAKAARVGRGEATGDSAASPLAARGAGAHSAAAATPSDESPSPAERRREDAAREEAPPSVPVLKTLPAIYAHPARRASNDRRAVLVLASASFAVLLFVAWRLTTTPAPPPVIASHALEGGAGALRPTSEPSRALESPQAPSPPVTAEAATTATVAASARPQAPPSQDDAPAASRLSSERPAPNGRPAARSTSIIPYE